MIESSIYVILGNENSWTAKRLSLGEGKKRISQRSLKHHFSLVGSPNHRCLLNVRFFPHSQWFLSLIRNMKLYVTTKSCIEVIFRSEKLSILTHFSFLQLARWSTAECGSVYSVFDLFFNHEEWWNEMLWNKLETFENIWVDAKEL